MNRWVNSVRSPFVHRFLRRMVASAFVCLMLTSLAAGGKYNEVLSIGDVAPAWTDLPGTDGKQHSLADHADKPIVVVIFTCASCPTAADYEERINALTQKYGGEQGQVAVVAICVNQIPEDQLPALTKRAQEKQLGFEYLYDENQKIAREFGAVFTPEFYVLDQQRQVVYMGAMDDSTDPEKVTQLYVEDAIHSILADEKPAIAEVIARGCRVRYARERRRRSAPEK